MSPQNARSIPKTDAEGSAGDPACGDALTMFIKVEKNRIMDISYLVFECCASIEGIIVDSIVTGSHEMFIGKIEYVHA